MNSRRYSILWLSALLLLVGFGCRTLTTPWPDLMAITPTALPTSTALPVQPVMPGEENPQEPVFISGEIPYTSPFFLNTISQPFVMLEDQAGFVNRDEEFEFNLVSQAIGPVEIQPDGRLTYSLALPAVPQGTLVDVDQNGALDTGVQIFAIAYWSNTWGGPFLETRDGRGWSNAYTSTITDPERDSEITGGILLVWSPDDEQSFPSGFGADDMLFTNDDPINPIASGYSLVNLDQSPFVVYKEARAEISLQEGEVALNDFSQLSYEDAFENLFQKASREYPFTEQKRIDWDVLYKEFSSKIGRARNDQDFYRLMRVFTQRIPDGHVGISLDGQVFLDDQGGSLGMVLTELTDGRVIVSQVLPETPAESQGIQAGAELLTWEGMPIQNALQITEPFFGPYSTPHTRRLEQAIFITRVPPGEQVTIEYSNPGSENAIEATLDAEVEYDSLFAAVPSFRLDPVAPPLEGRILDDGVTGYIRINTFSGDYALSASLWDHFMNSFMENEINHLIIDVRTNSGGSAGLALDFAGYFFDEEITLYTGRYYNEVSQQFEPVEHATRIEPAPVLFDGKVAVLIGPYCVSACEGFAYALNQQGRATLVGHFPTAGAFGEVGRGQYKLPGDYSIQFPTGRSETASGKIVIEGSGVTPEIIVPVTEDSALGLVDAVLEAALQALFDD